MEGYLVDYERVPITDEKSPEEQDFDLLVSHFISVIFFRCCPCGHYIMVAMLCRVFYE